MAIEAAETARTGDRETEVGRRLAWHAGESGQASVSFVAIVPLILLLGMGGLQAALAGHASIAASQAARAAARADYTGEDPKRAARAALPRGLRADVDVSTDDGTARVRVIAPRVLPFGPRIPVRSETALAGGEGLGG